MQVAPTTAAASAPEQGRRFGAAWYYCAALLVATALFFGAGLRLASSDWIARHSGNTYLMTVGYGAGLRGADCQVLIYGDSTAMVGIDPRIITERTGLTACNIAEFAGMSMVNGTMLLDGYLNHNRPPRYMVFDFAPENLLPLEQWNGVGTFEAYRFRIREYPNARTAWFLARHLPDTLSFIEQALWMLHNELRQPVAPESQLLTRAEHKGYLPTPGAPLMGCAPLERKYMPDAEWIRSLKTQYGGARTTVLVDVTPVPTCETVPVRYDAQHPTPTDNPLERYPIGLFNGTGRLHMTREGVERFSAEIADQILADKNKGANEGRAGN